MSLQAIVYASEAALDLSSEQLNELVEDAVLRNRLAGVTGVLLFDGTRFLQYIEGPDDGVSLVYSRIVNSRKHREIIELARGIVSQRRMPYWSMRWIPVADTQLKEAAFSDWTSLTRRTVIARHVPTGLDRLSKIAAPYIA
ncbi:MAG: BLUF domain-containing protein [Stenotrophomonas sp.]|uniref:BLUF domain-containing protein n=1 Tax=Gammaproteobacteria TaxID=1236 RepID=UPI003D6D703A